ncbi:MAG: hypothetical protein HQ582_10475 [Planctomycetes bacterium]|nr:hypothetical protein [Planctomycetota bacterium]
MRIVALCALCAVCFAGPAVADDASVQLASFGNVETAFASQQKEINSLRAELTSLRSMQVENAGYADDVSCCAEPGCGGCSGCGACGGIEGGVDITLFQVYANHGVGAHQGGNGFFEDFDTVTDARYWIGYQGANGLGIRGRYFDFDGGNTVEDEFVGLTMYDIEGTAELNLCQWDFLAFAGIRWGEIGWSDEDGGDGFLFEGIGTTLGVDARRPIWCNISAIGGIRYSALFGDVTEIEVPDNWATGSAAHGMETRLGLEWRRQCLVVSAVWEHQLYSSMSGNVDNDIDPEDVDITLGGPVIGISFER